MNDNQFDDFFRDKLGSHSSEVPGDMWQRVQEKKRRRFLFIPWNFFSASVVLLVVAFTGFYFFYNNTSNPKNNAAENISAETGKANVNNNNKRSDNDNTTVTNENLNAAKKLQDDSIANKNVLAGSANKKAVATPGKFFNPKPSFKKQTVNNNTVVDPGMQIQISSGQSADDTHADTAKNNYATTNGNTAISIQNKKKLKSDSLKNIPAEDTLKKNEFDTAKDRFALELYASPVFASGKFKSSNSNYSQFLNATTNFRWSYAFGLRMKIYITDNVFAKIGAEYTVINQKYSFALADDYSPSFNKYKSLDIPLLFGYQFNKNNYKLSVNAGVLVNVHSTYNGNLPNVDSTNILISSSFRKSTGASFYLSADFAQQLNDRVDIFAEPYLKYRLSNMALKNQSFTQKINTIGISFGARYKLFKPR